MGLSQAHGHLRCFSAIRSGSQKRGQPWGGAFVFATHQKESLSQAAQVVSPCLEHLPDLDPPGRAGLGCPQPCQKLRAFPLWGSPSQGSPSRFARDTSL